MHYFLPLEPLEYFFELFSDLGGEAEGPLLSPRERGGDGAAGLEPEALTIDTSTWTRSAEEPEATPEMWPWAETCEATGAETCEATGAEEVDLVVLGSDGFGERFLMSSSEMTENKDRRFP